MTSLANGARPLQMTAFWGSIDEKRLVIVTNSLLIVKEIKVNNEQRVNERQPSLSSDVFRSTAWPSLPWKEAGVLLRLKGRRAVVSSHTIVPIDEAGLC